MCFDVKVQVWEMYMYGICLWVFVVQDEFFVVGEEQFVLYCVDIVVGGGDGDCLVGQEIVGVVEGFVW